MTTPRSYSSVSLAAVLSLSLALGACAPSRIASNAAASAEGAPLALRFDNAARDYVHVYLVSETREWLLGRVEPGARATLRIPDDALAEHPGSMRLAVLAGQRVTLRAATEPGVAFTLAQPAGEILAQRWTFSKPLASGELTSLRVRR
ncbi:MAG: hypothetical protein ABI601_13470 [bacterium]